MRFSVRHATRYGYERPVRLAGHRLRFKPRPEQGRLLAYALTVEPEPAMREDRIDAYGNTVTHVDFAGLTDRLAIESRFELVTNAPDAQTAPDLPRLPWPQAVSGDLTAYGPFAPTDPEVAAFAARAADAAGRDPIGFLNRLNRTLYEDFDHRLRFDGAAMTPAETLAAGTGACRDVTILFVAACRSLGIPSRFVSGYQARSETPDGRRHLHAWPEAFLPSLGWRGFDPTHGLPVTDGHVALCAAPDQAAAMTVEGGYFGDKVASTLDYAIEIAAD